MPPLPRIRTAILADLARQLRFAPPETLRRQAARAEELATEIDPAQGYPEDWIVFRVTGHRPSAGGGGVVAGGVLLSDLSAFVERLTALAPRRWSDLPEGQFLDLRALAARWGVAPKTIERCRRRGLIAHRARGEDGRDRLAFPRPAVERFEAGHAADLARARRFSRIPPEIQRRMLRRAAVYRRRFGCSLNQAAARLAERFGRSLEAVRQVLRRHDARSGDPVFADPPLLSPRRRRVVLRAHRLGFDPAALARRWGRSAAGIRRVLADERAACLRRLGLRPATNDLARAPARDATEHAATRSGLGLTGVTDLLEFVRSARAQPAPQAVVERARASAYHDLVARAAAIIDAMPRHGASPADVDRAETLLRWAARLKAELVRSQLPLVLRSIEAGLDRPAEELRSSLLAGLVRDAVAAVAEAVDQYRPSARGGGRLAAPAGLAVTRVVTRFAREHAHELRSGSRASARILPGVAIRDWTRSVAPWQPALEPDPRVRAGLGAIDERDRRLLIDRFGWDGPPRTLAELAASLRTTVMRAAVMERRAIRGAIAATRSTAARAQ